MIRTIYQAHFDKGRWHLTIKDGEFSRDVRLPNNPMTREDAEREAKDITMANMTRA